MPIKGRRLKPPVGRGPLRTITIMGPGKIQVKKIKGDKMKVMCCDVVECYPSYTGQR